MTSRRLYLLASVAGLAWSSAIAQTAQPQFGGKYAELDERRQRLVDGWVVRLEKTTGQKIEPASLYDDIVSLSTKTTFVAVTHALMTTRLTDRAGADLGDALALVDRVDVVRGEVTGERGDHQFRIYVRLTVDAFDKLSRSQQFKRASDNSVYHKGYPINFRGQGGTPSIQISMATDRRNADVDVDYRASFFPVALFNGHLTASNSDVRAGNNYDKHLNRWTGFQNWWQGFFGVRLEQPADDADGRAAEPVGRASRRQEGHRGDGRRLPEGVARRRQRHRGEGRTSRSVRMRASRRTPTTRSSSIAAWRRFNC